MLQRWTAVVALVFVLVHVWELRLQRLFFGLPPEALYTALTAHLSSTWAGVPWRALFYVAGTLAVTAHFASGLRASVGDGRPRVRIVTVALGIALFLLGTATVIGVATGTRLLPAADDDSGPLAPCGSAVGPERPPLQAPRPAPSR
jgi:succinate dehydrogenase hydrophobic anchor subunit